MAPRKTKAIAAGEVSSTAPAAVASLPLPQPVAPLLPVDKIPAFLHFPLLVVISLATTTVANSLAAGIAGTTGAELASISRSLNEQWQIGAVLAWRVLELGIVWFSGFDDIDTLSLMILTHLPQLHLLHSFYEIPLLAVIEHALLIALSTAVPIALLRQRNRAHVPLTTFSYPILIPGAAIPVTHDTFIRFAILLLSSGIYTLVVYASFQTWLPTHLIVTFNGLKSMAPAHHGMLAFFLTNAFPIGFAVREFLFTPSVHPSSAAAATSADLVPADTFDPATASLGETVWYNLTWYSRLHPGMQGLTQRATVLVLWTAANTWFQAWVSIKGAEVLGALGWSAVWTTAAALCGLAIGWVGDVDA